MKSGIQFKRTRLHGLVACGRIFILLHALLLLVPVSAQEGQSAKPYRESIRNMRPMVTEGLDPDLAKVLDKYYEWTFSGPENWEKIESVRFDGLLHLANGVVRFVAFKKKPDYCKVVIFTGGNTRIVMAYDGEDAWQINTSVAGAEPTSMPEKEARNFIRDATIAGHLLYPAISGKAIELLGVDEVEDRTCYRIAITLPNGERITTFLDTANFTERRQVTLNAFNGLKEQITFSDFEKIEGILFPFASVMESAGEKVHRVEMLDVQLNLGVMPWMFERSSGIYLPGEATDEKNYDLFAPGKNAPSDVEGFGLEESGTTAFPDLEASEVQSIIDDIDKPQPE